MAYKYSTPIGENCAKAVGVALPISRKQSIMICQFVRNKNVQLAKKHLAEVIQMKRAVPFTRFNGDVGHKPGMAAGRYPVKACEHILALLESAESNAQFKGLSTSDLIVSHISAQKGPDTWRYGRHIRRQAKRTHIEVVLEERKTQKSEAKLKKKSVKPKVKKTETSKSENKNQKPAVKKNVKQDVKKTENKPAEVKEEKQEVKAK